MTRCARHAWLALSGFTAIALAAADPAFFASKVYPALENAQCRSCHAHDGVASGTRLHFPPKDAGNDAIQTFGISLGALVDRAGPSKSVLLTKPTNRTAHTGGQRIKPGSDDERLLVQWVEHLASLSDDALAAARAPAVKASAKPNELVRRLTHSQYNNTVRDLLGDDSRPALRFPPEDYVDGFKNQSRGQGMSPLLIESYSAAAEKLALNAFRAGDANRLVPCKPASADDEKCRDRFVHTFGRRAFRRPLLDAEFQRYAAAFSAQARASGKFLEGARAVVEAMLQSPKFLFHVEAGPDGRFRDYAVASRYSYLLWDTMPSEELFEAASRGELQAVAGRDRWARRMVQSPQARQAADEFFSQWLRFDRVLNAFKERRRFPEFTPELAAAMVEETRRLLQDLVWKDGNFMDAFRADYGFLNADLSTLYKVPAPQGEFQLVRFPRETPRAGLLGQASFLASSAGPTETSPTARGIFVREQLLCQHVPPPPPNINTTLAEPSEEKPLTRRQRLAAHVDNPTCAACHRLMDPIGFGLESFDAIGRWRDKETILVNASEENRRPKRIDLPLETGGEIAGLPNSAFSNARQLGSILAESPVCQTCIVRQLFRYAVGRLETPADQEVIDRLSARFRESGFRFQELLIALGPAVESVPTKSTIGN